MQIDLRLLRQAQALAEHGSFIRAAQALNIAQPTLSRSIKELEARVGLPLFNRSRSGHEPTDFGRVFLQHAVELLAKAGDLEREVALTKGLRTGDLSVGCGPYVVEELAPLSAARFVAAHPGVRLRILMDDPASVARLLRTRKVDLCVAEASILENDDDFEVVAKLVPVAAFVVVRSGHPLTTIAQPDIGDVLEFPYAQVAMLSPRLLKPILAARRSETDDRAVSLPFPAIECPTLQVASKIVVNSDAFTFATLGMIRAELEQQRVVALPQPGWLRTEWSIVRLRKRTMSPAMIAFGDELQRTHLDVVREEELLRKRWYPSGDGTKGDLDDQSSPCH